MSRTSLVDYRDDDFEWDVAKSERNHRIRQLDFRFALRVFEDEMHIDIDDDRIDYGEERHKCVGVVEGVLVTVAFTWRGARRRIISAWRSSKSEQHEYFKSFR